MRKLCLAFLACLALSAPAQAYKISYDEGGNLKQYFDRYNRVNYSGESVVVDGPCLSACTLVLGLVPRSRICVTKRATMGFHSAHWRGADGFAGPYSHLGTQILLETYPSDILTWIHERGGLNPKMIYLQGDELEAMVQRCR